MSKQEIFKTKVTYLGNGLYGCRVIKLVDNKPIVEMRVPKGQIADAIHDMLRMLHKCGWQSPMAIASRHRGKSKVINVKLLWLR